jgi:PRC-barrel domain protein
MDYLSPWSLRFGLAPALALALTMAPAALPGTAQAPPQKPKQPQPSLDGLPLYTSDGKEIGKVITMGVDEDNEPVLVAEIAQQLGLGSMAIAVPKNMFVHKGGRVELTITEAEVSARLGK